MELTNITIELQIEEDTSLVIFLHKDGTINRKGDGTTKIDKNFFMGLTETIPIIEKLNRLIDEEFEQYLNNVYDLPDKKGKTCSIEIILANEKETKGVKFFYGSDSYGPPKPIGDFVIKAIELTDPWYNTQQKMIKKNKKAWWQFWK